MFRVLWVVSVGVFAGLVVMVLVLVVVRFCVIAGFMVRLEPAATAAGVVILLCGIMGESVGVGCGGAGVGGGVVVCHAAQDPVCGGWGRRTEFLVEEERRAI